VFYLDSCFMLDLKAKKKVRFLF